MCLVRATLEQGSKSAALKQEGICACRGTGAASHPCPAPTSEQQGLPTFRVLAFLVLRQ